METLGDLVEELQKRIVEHGPDMPVRTYMAGDWGEPPEVPFTSEYWTVTEIREYIGPPSPSFWAGVKTRKDERAAQAAWRAAERDPKNWKTHKVLMIS